MTIASNQLVVKKIKSGQKYVQFADKDNEYKLIDNIPLGLYSTAAIHPASFWRSWFDRRITAIEEKEKPAVVTETKIRALLQPRYIRHFLLGDVEAKSANINTLHKQARKLKVAKIPYKFPTYDCEDRSFACMGAWHLNEVTAAMATYIIWVTYTTSTGQKAHALNGLCDGEQFYLYEPALYKAFIVPDFWMIDVLMG